MIVNRLLLSLLTACSWLLLLLPYTLRAEEFIVGYLTNIQGGRNMVSRQGYIVSGAIGYAVASINKGNTSFLKGHSLKLIYNDTRGDRLIGTRAVIDQWSQGAVAFFGPEDSCDVEATVATALNLPMISYKCADSKVSKKEFYTTFARTQPPDKRIVRSVISLLTYYRWFKFSIISQQNPQSQAVADSLETEASNDVNNNFSINSKRTFEGQFSCCEHYKDCCENGFINIVEHTYQTTRIYVFIGSTRDLMKMMLTLRLKGLLDTGQYVVIYIELETYTQSQSWRYFWHSGMHKEDAQSVLEAARSLLIIVPSPPHGEDYTDFEEKVREYNQKLPFNFSDPFTRMKKHITIFGSYLYDAVMLYAEALDTVLKSSGDPRNGTDIIRRIIARKRYKSVTGAWMQIDENGDTEGNYTVLSRQHVPANLSLKGFNETKHQFSMLPVGSFFYNDQSNNPAFKLLGTIDWVDGGPPLEEPPCGFDGSQCKAPPDQNREIAASVLASLLVLVSLVAAITYRNWKYEQEIAGLLWKIDIRDIQRGHPEGIIGCPSKMSLASQVTAESRVFTPAFTQTAAYKGTWVAIKHLTFSRKMADIPRETKKEMKMMREIHNDNVNPFIGACVEHTGIVIITEYCAKGSLQDILENSDIKLDNMFIASLVMDLIKAMAFLHESDIKIHGNLKSSNCLVTSRWMLQVADFGVHELRATAARENLSDEQHYRSQLWNAPELLRNAALSIKGTQKGDVYAFAIILHEIIGRQGPFGNLDLSPQEIVGRVKEEPTGESFRPPLAGLECQDFVLQTMKDCWAEKPEARPDFRHIRQRLGRMKEGMKSNIMDNMMAMMEKYADNLEELVNERTAQLVEEQKKTEALLHRMLPKSVAQELMRGEPVIPEAFDAVTIYFSDIVGFTEMSANSTPMEVVTFLNDLYTVFDDIIGHYDVYKVETIGDAYMVVSGLPIRNGDHHASEIASMALELLDSIRAFRIRHRPHQTLKLRIGLHTGPVVAGVVGLTMPRYCLFGDTVNTASRMESNGEALRIHVSPDCQMYLERLGGYILKERGLVKMKGKGELLTFWLEGLEEGPLHRREVKDLVLPQPLFPPASSMMGRRSPKLSVCEVLPRRSSLAVRHEAGGLWSAALPGIGLEDATPLHGVPTFLRLQQQDNNSPRSSPQNIRDGRLMRLRESDKERSSSSCGDIPTSPNSKVTVNVNNGFTPSEEHEIKQNGFVVGGDEVRPLLNIRPNQLLPVQEELADRNHLSAPLLLDGSSSKRWKSCDAIALPKGPQGIKGLISGIFSAHSRRLDLDHRRGSNPTVGLYRAKPEKLSCESAV